MKIAILGATSEIAKDLILSFEGADLHLFARNKLALDHWMVENNKRYPTRFLSDFSRHHEFDAIINFIGAGSPERIQQMGSNISYVTGFYDLMVLDYLEQHKDCQYIFISSGAVFGDNFDTPASAQKMSSFPINDIQPHHYYGVAKAQAEYRHRLSDRNIIDLRVFSYYSSTMNPDHQFMVSQMVQAVMRNETFRADKNRLSRDYMGPKDFYQMIQVLLKNNNINQAVDCYSRAPVTKEKLLEGMSQRYGMKYVVSAGSPHHPATVKPCYYSTNTAAYTLGYRPTLTSLETIFEEADKLLK
jgi:nucleoside-diphosphate-sugar epimerase